MLTQLEQARAGAAWLNEFVVQTGADRLRSALISAADDDPDLGPAIHAINDEFGDQIGELTETGYRIYRTSVSRQQQALAKELGALLSAQPSEGDLFKGILCSVAALTVVGGLVTTVIPPHAHGIAITAAGGKAFRSFKCDLRELDRIRSYQL